MNQSQSNQTTTWRRGLSVLAMLAMIVGLCACSHAAMMFGTGARRPAVNEFGLGY